MSERKPISIKTYPAARAPKEDELFIMQVPVIHNCHFSEEDQEFLFDPDTAISVSEDGNDCLVMLDDLEPLLGEDADCIGLVSQLRTLGYAYFRISPYGDVFCDLKRFDPEATEEADL